MVRVAPFFDSRCSYFYMYVFMCENKDDDDDDETRHILLSNSPNCTVLRAVVLTQYRRVTDRRTDRQTDGQTDGIAVASTALAMQALRRAVISSPITLNKNSTRAFQRAINQGSTPPRTFSKWG